MLKKIQLQLLITQTINIMYLFQVFLPGKRCVKHVPMHFKSDGNPHGNEEAHRRLDCLISELFHAAKLWPLWAPV